LYGSLNILSHRARSRDGAKKCKYFEKLVSVVENFDLDICKIFYSPFKDGIFVHKNLFKNHIELAISDISDISNISDGEYNNFYLQTYNWNLFSPTKIPHEFLDQYKNQETRNNNEHKDFYYVS
jgi:hypothetical protein